MLKKNIQRRKEELDKEEENLLVLLNRVRINKMYLHAECDHEDAREGTEECPDCGKDMR